MPAQGQLLQRHHFSQHTSIKTLTDVITAHVPVFYRNLSARQLIRLSIDTPLSSLAKLFRSGRAAPQRLLVIRLAVALSRARRAAGTGLRLRLPLSRHSRAKRTWARLHHSHV